MFIQILNPERKMGKRASSQEPVYYNGALRSRSLFPMYIAPHFIRSLHFVGIGGIGMSGLAEILSNQGYAVQGSDVAANANVRRLQALGIPVAIGHTADNIRGAQALVVSTAVPDTNPEIQAARALHIPVITRGEMLAEIARLKKTIAISGTHGKTTTTSLIAALLKAGSFDPTVINGGIINTLQTNARLGQSDWMVVEADESDGSFLKVPSIINVITNIDCEHMNYYGTVERLEEAFTQFIRNLPFYGLGIICSDHPRVRALFMQDNRRVDRRIVTYGFEGCPHYKAENLRMTPRGMTFDVLITQDTPFLLGPSGAGVLPSHRISDVFIPMFGRHNVLNALAALATAHELEIPSEISRAALAVFEGVKRRFTILGCQKGVTFVDDYAHHPSEIRAVLEAGRQTEAKRLVAVFQPHRYTRFTAFFDTFVDVLSAADITIVLPVYAAGETASQEDVDRFSYMTFAAALRSRGKEAFSVADEAEFRTCLKDVVRKGDFVIGLGAGSISDIMGRLVESF